MRREHKIRVWRCIAFVGLFLCFLLGLGVGAHAQNANDILGKAAAAYENSNGISASVTIVEISSAITIIASMPAPTQTIIIGPSAIFGNAFNTTIYGSRMRERVLREPSR